MKKITVPAIVALLCAASFAEVVVRIDAARLWTKTVEVSGTNAVAVVEAPAKGADLVIDARCANLTGTKTVSVSFVPAKGGTTNAVGVVSTNGLSVLTGYSVPPLHKGDALLFSNGATDSGTNRVVITYSSEFVKNANVE